MKQRGHFERALRQRVLIVGINYAPEHTGNAPYTTALAEELVARGCEVEVLTGIPHYPQWQVPAEYKWRFASRIDGNPSLIRLRHFVPASQSALKRGWFELTFAVQALAARRRSGEPEVVVAVVPNLLSALSAAFIARRARARLVVWLQDSMAAAARQSGISGGGRVAALVEAAERHALIAADDVVIVSEAFRAHVLAVGVSPERIHLIANWTHVSAPTANRAQTRRDMGWGDEIIALHAGNMGLKQGLEVVVDAARSAQAQGVAVRFVLMGNGSQRARLGAIAEGVANLSFLDPVPAGDFSDVLAAADCLLVTEAPGVFDMSLPSKLTSYLVAGRPIVGSVHKGGGTANTLNSMPASILVPPGDGDALLAGVKLAQTLPRVEVNHIAPNKAVPAALVKVVLS